MATPSCIAPLSDDDFADLSDYISILDRMYKNTKLESDVLKKNLVLGALYIKINEIFKTTDLTPIKLTGTYINDVISYIELHYAEKIPLEDLANIFYVSRTKLSTDFKKTTGMTVNSFHTLTRLKNAKLFLETGMSVTETSEKCGFTSSGYFINTFVSHNRITPFKYRQLMKQK